MKQQAIQRCALLGLFLVCGCAGVGAKRSSTQSTGGNLEGTVVTRSPTSGSSREATARITIDVNRPGIELPPKFYGLMIEEINHSFDGGLYPELIQNRTFQDDGSNPIHWSPLGSAKIVLDRSEPVNAANPVCLRVDLSGDGTGGAANDGYWGIPVKPATNYVVSFYARGAGGFAGPVTAVLIGDDGTEFAKATTRDVDGTWTKYSLTLRTTADVTPTSHARFALSATGTGSVSFNLVSLMPPTYLDAPGGLRPDLMKMLAELRPAFVRLPGGNYLEGNTLDTRFDWKKQIGPVELRLGHTGCWGYRGSDAMGLPQMLLMCRQLNAEPLLAVFAGLTLRQGAVKTGPALQPFVDEALEEIEYLTGGPSTPWGSKRVADGLAEPFKLTYVEIGNEDWTDGEASYDARFTQMYDAIRAKYPHLKIIATAQVKSRTPDLYDDHFYQSPAATVTDAGHYDAPEKSDAAANVSYSGGHFRGTFTRGQVPEVLCGEWATQNGQPTPTLRATLADAVWLMGIERNADLVRMECYAPLLANVNPKAWQWPTNLIGYNAMSAFGSPSYYAQVMFAQNKVDRLLPIAVEAPELPVAPAQAPRGAVGLGAWRTDVEYKDLSVTATDGSVLLSSREAEDLRRWTFGDGQWVSHDGILKPAERGVSWGTVGDADWQDYTVHLKARKTAGEEGFLLLWHAADVDTYNWLNVGAWGNSGTAAQIAREGGRVVYGKPSTFRPQTGIWYDFRIEVSGHTVRFYVDDKLIVEAADPAPPPRGKTLYAGAGYLTASDEVIIKVVNFGDKPIDATLNLCGVWSVRPEAKLTVLRGEPGDTNSIDAPTKVAPTQETISDASAAMQRTFPPNSLTLLRLQVGPGR